MRGIVFLCVLAGGCFVEASPGPAQPRSSTDIVGCITGQHSGKRRIWWLGSRVASRDRVERALADSPVTHDQARRAGRESRASVALFLAGMATVAASIGGLAGWLQQDGTQLPLVLLAPAAAGYALTATGVALGIHGDARWRRAIDDYNDAATANDRCPP